MAVCDHHNKLGYLSMLYIRVTPPCCDNCTLVKIQTKMSNKNMKMNEMTNFTVFGEVKLFSHMTNLFQRETSLYIIFNALLVIYKLSIFLLPARP
jgi:hypothetical protein